LDEYHPTQHYVAALLERKVKVLIYVGKYDWICNHVGNEAWTLNLEWSGHDEFSAQALREWKVDGKTAGSTRSAQGLTFATINGAGHMVASHFIFSIYFFPQVDNGLPCRCHMTNPRNHWNLLIDG